MVMVTVPVRGNLLRRSRFRIGRHQHQLAPSRARLRGALRQPRLADTVEVIGAALAREAAGMGIGVDADTLDHADELLPTLLPTLGSVLDHDAVSVISCPVDFSGHLRLTGRLGRLDEAL